ncbi:NAD-dependent protein deacylase [Thalassoglobus neptunius]|uniref:protein acetyllysine N-acetyltransferase n=1 Tax=Thalassoglobus neptunius TaxID=1938619 RepID=A0A5C5X5Z2_9PLAN|nr:Sir2 family NAD-dependent protein deacetylase [Thalassoglobus neptunius]TWT58344.1 NAD-dependent protein deacylase [Thalassoglobus neptunius]
MTLSVSSPEPLRQLADLVSRSKRGVIFTGAGVGTASGISTFRDMDGLWARFPPEDFANWAGLLRTATLQPARFAEFLISVLEPIATAQPNPAHLAITELQSIAKMTVITQNIDGLQQDASAIDVYELHGTLFEIVQTPSGEVIRHVTRSEVAEVVDGLRQSQKQLWSFPSVMRALKPIFEVSSEGVTHPNVVLFGDQLREPDWSLAIESTESCDLFIAVGTSQTVRPASDLISIARESGAEVVYIDPECGGRGLWIRDHAECVLPELLQLMTNHGNSEEE